MNDQQPADSSLNSLIRIWCLLISSDSWSKELRDVSSEVVTTITDVMQSSIQPNDIEASAAKLVHVTINLVTMATIDSNRQHVLPTSIRLISCIVRMLLGDGYSLNTQIKLAEIAYLLIKLCESIINRYCGPLLLVYF